MCDRYMTPEQAREKWSHDTGLLIEMAPKFPAETREYAEYAAQLRDELSR